MSPTIPIIYQDTGNKISSKWNNGGTLAGPLSDCKVNMDSFYYRDGLVFRK